MSVGARLGWDGRLRMPIPESITIVLINPFTRNGSYDYAQRDENGHHPDEER
jgi:hypothetical protein